MANTVRTAPVTVAGCVLLLFAAAVHLASAQGGKGTRSPFEASAEQGDSGIFSVPLVTGDTGANDPTDHCEGALLPDNNRGFFTNFRNCLTDLTLPGKDGTLGNADDIVMDRGSMSVFQDKTTGNVVAIRFFFQDLNDNQYQTDVLSVSPPSPISTAASFTIHVHAENVEVRPQGKNKPVVGHVSVGDIVYTPK